MAQFRHTMLVFAATVSAVCFAACDRKPPTYELKPEVGDAQVVQWDTMEEQPKYMRVRKTEREKMLAVEDRKKKRMKAMAIYQGAYGFTEP